LNFREQYFEEVLDSAQSCAVGELFSTPENLGLMSSRKEKGKKEKEKEKEKERSRREKKKKKKKKKIQTVKKWREKRKSSLSPSRKHLFLPLFLFRGNHHHLAFLFKK